MEGRSNFLEVLAIGNILVCRRPQFRSESEWDAAGHSPSVRSTISMLDSTLLKLRLGFDPCWCTGEPCGGTFVDMKVYPLEFHPRADFEISWVPTVQQNLSLRHVCL